MGTESFPGVKRTGPVDDDPPHLAPRLKEEWPITLLKLWTFVACSRDKFIFIIIIIIIILCSIYQVLHLMREQCAFCEVIYASVRIS